MPTYLCDNNDYNAKMPPSLSAKPTFGTLNINPVLVRLGRPRSRERSLCVCACSKRERSLMAVKAGDRGANGVPVFACGDILRVRGGYNKC